MRKGCFIVFEGIDGSGKSEQYERLVKKIEKENYRLVSTREPTKGTEIGNLIHSVLYENKMVSEETLALLFAADRIEHTINKIVPALQENSIVISDRYVYSSLAYQTKGMKKELEFNWVSDLNKFAIKPDIVIYLDITAETGQNRLFNGQVRLKDHTYFENIIQQEKIRSVYYSIFNFDKKTLFDFGNLPTKISRDFSMSKRGRTTVIRINGDLSINKIENLIFKQVQKILERKKFSTKTKQGKVKTLMSFK